jgi:bacteriorhodopsin
MGAPVTAVDQAVRRRRVRRSAWLWALVAGGFYLAFVALTLLRGWK